MNEEEDMNEETKPPADEITTQGENGNSPLSAKSIEANLPSVRLGAGLFGRVREVVDLFLQRLVLRSQFAVLKLKVNYLLAESIYLRKRNRQLKDRLFELRGWHVQLPQNDEQVAGGGHEKPNVKWTAGHDTYM